jgi:hypothetical protein
MPTLLRNADGTLATRGGILQAIPDGGTAADCICCDGGGGGLPDCNYCEFDGGPFRRLDFTQTVSGFPTAQHDVYFLALSCGGGSNRYAVFKCSGLDAINGTYEYSSNETCLGEGLQFDVAATVVYERRFLSFGQTLPCTQGTIEATYTWTSLRVTLTPGEVLVTPTPIPASPPCYPVWRAQDASGTVCDSRSGGNSQTLRNGLAVAATPCPGSSDFPYAFTTTVLGVP